AVSHGWHGARGLSAGMKQINGAEQWRGAADGAEDLPDFVGAVVEAETSEPAITVDELRLPKNWLHGLDGLPGFDPAAGVLRFNRDFEAWRDSTRGRTGVFRRAHTLVL